MVIIIIVYTVWWSAVKCHQTTDASVNKKKKKQHKIEKYLFRFFNQILPHIWYNKPSETPQKVLNSPDYNLFYLINFTNFTCLNKIILISTALS